MEQTGKTASIARLHQALRENRRGEAQRIARDLRQVYRDGDHPRSLLAFIESVLADGTEGPGKTQANAEQGAGSTDGPTRPWHALPGADIPHLRAALGLWNQLHPNSQQLCAPGDRDPASLPAEGLTPGDLERLLIGWTPSLPWLDAWYVGSHQLRLRVGGAPGGSWGSAALRWQVLQWQPEQRRLASCGVISPEQEAEGLHDLQLHQPLAPLLLLGGDGDGGVAEIALLPFPSLLRHGVHHGELVAELDNLASSQGLRIYSLSCLERLLRGHHPRVRSWSITPPEDSAGGWVSRPSVRQWLEQISATEPHPRMEAPTTIHLHLDGDGLPSVRALTGLEEADHEDSPGEAAFVVVDPVGLRPMLQIRPGRQPAGVAAQIRVEHGGDGGAQLPTSDTIAIVMATDASPRRLPLWWPTEPAGTSPEAGLQIDGKRPIEVVIAEAADQEDLQFSLWSLSQQRGVTIDRIWLPALDAESQQGHAPTEALIASLNAEGIRLERGGLEGLGPLLAGCRSRGTLLCLMAAGVCLHEQATLLTLAELLRPEEVATAGCLLIHERQRGRQHSVEASSCGLVPGPFDSIHGNRLELVQQTLQAMIAMDDRSVIANVNDLVLVDPSQRHWQLSEGTKPWMEEGMAPWLKASLGAILQGSLHRATARISAHYRTSPQPDRRFHAELPSSGITLGQALPRLLAASTCSRRLKP